MVLSITNRYQIPYGILSLGYNDPIKINETTYMSVIDYVSSELGRKLTEPYELSFYNLWDETEKNVMNKALKDSINAKLSQDPLFENLLFSAEDRPFLYKSDNNYLGVDEFNNGENVYGKWLTSVRNYLREDNPNVFYNVFILDRYLKEAINFEPLDNYLDLARKGYGTKVIINSLHSKYNYIDIPSKEFVEGTRKITKDFNYQPEKVILNVMKNKIRKTRVANLNQFKFKVFQAYLENFWKKNNIKYDIFKFLRKLKSSDRDYFINRIYSAYNIEKLQSIDNPLGIGNLKPDKYIPSSKLVENYESLEFQGIDNKLPVESIYAIVNSKTSKLSLSDDRIVLDIEQKKFPTMAHYIIYKLGYIIKSENFKPYSMIFNENDKMFYKLEIVRDYFENLFTQYKINYANKRLYEAIMVKYNKPHIKDILKSTGNNIVPISGFLTKFTTETINDIKNKISWKELTKDKGNVIDYIDKDDFFIYVLKDMFESFMNIYITVFSNDEHRSLKITNTNVKIVYEQFFGNVPGTILKYDKVESDTSNIKNMSKSMNILLPEESYNYLNNKFLNRILCAEDLAKKIFKTNIIYASKFLILEGRFRIFDGEFCLERNKNNKDRFYLALIKVLNAISICHKDKVINIDMVDKAFSILNNVPNLLILETEKNIENFETSENQIDVGENIITSELIQNINNEESDDEKEIEGYETDDNDEDQYFDDLVFALESNTKLNPKYFADTILYYLKPSEEVRSYILLKTDELVQSKTKNLYRINLYSC